jgi:hypothetical protein
MVHLPFSVAFVFNIALLGKEPKASCILGKHSTLEVRAQPFSLYFVFETGSTDFARTGLELDIFLLLSPK